MNKFTIGTRGSELALWQANMVRTALEHAFPTHTFEIKIIRTTGDQVQEVALSKVGDKGLFTRQIEAELLDGSIDLAVHSLKDLQTEQPEGLVIGAVCKREISTDLLISRDYTSIDELPQGAKVATGSLRRRSQLLNLRPDVEIVEIRGNVPTRLNKFAESDLDAMILAYAGVHRLGLTDRFKCTQIPADRMIPAVGQGAVAVEVRSGDDRVRDVVGVLNDEPTALAVTAERAFLRRLEGGCQVPIGAAATLDGDSLRLDGVVGSLDGKVIFREITTGSAASAHDLGVALADCLIAKGAAELIGLSRVESEKSAGAVL